MTTDASHLDAGDVPAWFASIDLLHESSRRARALGWLTGAERDRYDRFRHDRDRLMFLLGRVMARTIVGRLAPLAPTAWTWREGPHGRPEIGDDRVTLQFNLAHSAGLVLCAAAEGRAVGIDVEDLERHPTEPEIMRRYCAPEEVADIEAQGPAGWRARFLAYWTLKEAYLKARGLGISVPLAEIRFRLGPPTTVEFRGSLAGTDTAWAFELRQVTPRHLAAVAAPVTASPPAFRFAPLPEAWLP